jgi:hypothetical protein
VKRPTEDWLDLLGSLTEAYGLVAPRLETALRARQTDVAFIGLGIDSRLERRLNVYLKTRDLTRQDELPDGELARR